jgi:hypothetical protein
VTGAKVQDGSLTGTDILDGSIGGADIQDGSIGGADVQDNSITGTDINELTLSSVNASERNGYNANELIRIGEAELTSVIDLPDCSPGFAYLTKTITLPFNRNVLVTSMFTTHPWQVDVRIYPCPRCFDSPGVLPMRLVSFLHPVSRVEFSPWGTWATRAGTICGRS